MMKTPLISVITPAYNSAEYLPHCLDSLLAQSLTDFEIIVIDDGSTDGTPDIIKTYAARDNRIQYFQVSPNMGVSNGRNVGLEHAVGEYVFFCDSDDEVPPDAFRALYHAAVKGRSDVVVAAFKVILREGECSIFHYEERNQSDIAAIFSYGALWNKLFNRAFLTAHSLRFENYAFCEDTLFIGRAFCCKPSISRTPEVVYHYLQKEDIQTNQITKEYSLERVKGIVASCSVLYGLPFPAAESDIFQLYLHWLTHAFDVFNKIPLFSERELAFPYFQSLVEVIDWAGREAEFQDFFQTDYATFMNLSYVDYLTYLVSCNHIATQQERNLHSRNHTLQQFRDGKVGFRYIIKYAQAWLQFKLKGPKDASF